MTLLWGKLSALGAGRVGAAGLLEAGKVAGEVRKDSLTHKVVSCNFSVNALGVLDSALSLSGDVRECCV